MRLSFDITPEQHQYLKAVAAIQGKRIKSYVLARALPDSQQQAAFAKLVARVIEYEGSTLITSYENSSGK